MTILDLQGNLTIGSADDELRKRVEELVAREQKYLLINLANVPMIDSSGIGGLVKSFTHAKDSGGKLKLLKPTRLANQLLSSPDCSQSSRPSRMKRRQSIPSSSSWVDVWQTV